MRRRTAVLGVGVAVLLGGGAGIAALVDGSGGDAAPAGTEAGASVATTGGHVATAAGSSGDGAPSESVESAAVGAAAQEGLDGPEAGASGASVGDRSGAPTPVVAVLRTAPLAGPWAPAGSRPLTAPPPPDPNAVDAAGLTQADRDAGLVSADVPAAATGTLVVAPDVAPDPPPAARVKTVRVEVEAGLAVDPALFAATVMAVLNDPRGWGGDGSTSFAQTEGDAEIRVVLASPALTDRLCAPLETVGRYSCGRNGAAVLNHHRWVQATPEFTDRSQYRAYLVNHEVGHLLGKPHVQCPGDGALAPVMQQQTIQVAPCLPNGWPFPDVGG